jgi:hypothetical protein
MPEPAIKAVAFNSIAAELRRMCDEERFARVVAALPPETAALIEHSPLPVSWVPQPHVAALVRAAYEVAFRRDERRLQSLAARAIVSDLSVVYRFFVRLASPEWVIERVASMWKAYYRDNGAVTVERQGERCVHVCYRGLPRPSPLFWSFQCGTIRGIARATGVTDVTTRVLEISEATGDCTIEATWRPPA